jgi:hypothetical protein
MVSWVEVIGWAEISDYIGIRREMKGQASVPIGFPSDRMKPLDPHTTTERINRRQGQGL